MGSFPETYFDPNYDSAPSIPKVKRNCLPARSRRNCSLFQGCALDRVEQQPAWQLARRSKEGEDSERGKNRCEELEGNVIGWNAKPSKPDPV